MQPVSPEAGTSRLISRLQHLLAVCLWFHELRGRLAIAFIDIAGIRVRSSDFRDIRSKVARTFFNFNSSLQSVEDSVAAALESQSSDLSSLQARLRGVELLPSLLSILLLQTLRLLAESRLCRELEIHMTQGMLRLLRAQLPVCKSCVQCSSASSAVAYSWGPTP